MVSINDLKLDIVRKVIPIDIGGEKKYIHVFNAFDDHRKNVLVKLKEIQELDISGEEMVEETYKYLYHQFSDLNLDGSITESIKNPSLEMLELRKEIDLILDEIQYEYQINQLLQLNNIRNTKLSELSISRIEEIKNLEKEIEDK